LFTQTKEANCQLHTVQHKNNHVPLTFQHFLFSTTDTCIYMQLSPFALKQFPSNFEKYDKIHKKSCPNVRSQVAHKNHSTNTQPLL